MLNVADKASPERYVQDLPRPEMFEDTLFIAQLREAQLTQLQSAKREFFNAEILAREVADKGVQDEVDALNTLGATVHSRWEHRFNSACTTCVEAHLPGLHGGVMRAIEDHCRAQRPTPLRVGVVHSFGVMHQLVEAGTAGWVRHFAEVAARHGR